MNNKKRLYIFLLVLPIIDLITSVMTRFLSTSISLGVFVKIIFLGVMLYYLVFKSTSKHKKLCLTYVLLIFIYMIFYILSKIKYMDFSIFIKEAIYLIKLIYFPTLLACLFCYFDDKKISKNELWNVLKINLISYSILLLIPLLTNTGFSTYENGLSGTIGWFFSANEISIILIILFPYIYTLIKNKRIFWVVVPIIIILIIATIGTKASMVGLVIDSIILMILSCFYKVNKKLNIKLISFSFIIMSVVLLVFTNSSSLNNLKQTFGIQEKQNIENAIAAKEQEEKLISEEIRKLDSENIKTSKFIEEFIDKYGKALLSDRDIYFEVTYKLYRKNYNFNILLFGLGYSNTSQIKNFAITKLIEIDPLDIFFHSGLMALIIVFLPFIYFIYYLFKSRKFNINIIFYFLMLGMIFCVSCISGHTLMAPAVNIYIVLYFILAYTELGLIEEKKSNIEKGKVTIYSLHLNYGGIEKDIVNKANTLSKIYNVEIISVYKLNDKPVFKINNKVKISYLTLDIKPNKEEFKIALKNKNILNIIKEGLKSIKILYLKNTLLNKSMTECNSEIIISTRLDFTKKLINNNEFKNIKIAQEHVYHNNNDKYLNNLYYILKKIDYLMPSSNYLTNYYKELFPKYSYKIVTNHMSVETDNSISNLKNKNIISVGRLSKEKAFDDLIRIFKTIVKNNKEWVLNIVGDGPEHDNLNSLIKELKLEDNVKLLGNKNAIELNKLYKDASIYVMTSLEESFGLVLLEAASHGLPIVAYSSALGACEILKDNNGILVDNRDEINMIKSLENFINSTKLRKEYQKKSLNISKIYSYDNIEKYNLNFFETIKKNDIYNNLYKKSKKEFYEIVENRLKNKEKTFIITANSETYILSEKDKEMNDIINNKNNYIVPDGISIVKTANYLDYNIKERITGIDLAEYLFEIADKNKYKVYLFGAKIEVIEKLENIIKDKYPNIKLLGATNGYVNDKESVMEYIRVVKPDIVMLAIGIPHQEKLINKYIDKFDKGIFIGVGGSFDVLSGEKKRAPQIFIKLNLEWFYRIIKEPKRIIRFLKYNIKFLFKIIKEKYKW